MHLTRHPRVFYGYWIVAVTFFCLFIFSGLGFYSFSLFVTSLQADLGWSRSEVMVAWSISFLVMGAASPFVGRIVDRYGPRKIIAIGAFIGGLGFIPLSFMDSLWHFYAGYAVIGIGMAAMGTVSTSAVVSNWFQRKRGLAVGIMSAGIGVGGLVLAPLIGGYLIPAFGWRTAYLVMVLLMWALIPAVLAVIKAKPEDMGLNPDGAARPEATAEVLAASSAGLTLKIALGTAAFWLIAVAFLVNGLCQSGIVQNQVPHLEDIGFPVTTAVAALGVVGLGSTVGKFGFGWLCDRIPVKYACAIGLTFQAAGLIIFMSVGSTSPTAMVLLYAIFMGLGVGSWLPTLSMLVSTSFGLASYGAIFGLGSLLLYGASAVGPLLAAYIYDTMNTYHWAFLIFLVAYVIAILAVLAARRPRLGSR